MAIQAVIPLVLLGGVDHALQPGGTSLTPYVLGIVGLALLRGLANFLGRYLLFKTAYGIEYDFRTIVYEHLAGMPYSFYDRVQSGQLISRANSDIRSVQLYLTFAPMILLQFAGAVLVFVIMLTVNAELALDRDRDGAAGRPVRDHAQTPALPDLLGGTGACGRRRDDRRRERQRRPHRQVVRRRGPAGRPPRPGGAAAAVGDGPGRRHPRQVQPRDREPPAPRACDHPPRRRLHGAPRTGHGRDDRRVQRVPPPAAGALPDGRGDHDDGPAGEGLGRPDLRAARREARDRGSRRAGRAPPAVPARCPSSPSRSATAPGRSSSTGSTWSSAAARPWRSWAARRAASRRSPA